MDGPAYQQVFCLPNILQKFVLPNTLVVGKGVGNLQYLCQKQNFVNRFLTLNS